MGAREIYEGSWYFLCVILSNDIVSYKIYKKRMDILSVFIILWGSGCVQAIQWSKCDQAKQFLKRNSTYLFQAK